MPRESPVIGHVSIAEMNRKAVIGSWLTIPEINGAVVRRVSELEALLPEEYGDIYLRQPLDNSARGGLLLYAVRFGRRYEDFAHACPNRHIVVERPMMETYSTADGYDHLRVSCRACKAIITTPRYRSLYGDLCSGIIPAHTEWLPAELLYNRTSRLTTRFGR